jgi:hypothetical protein
MRKSGLTREQMVKARRAAYWATTTLIACDAIIAGAVYLAHAQFIVKAFAHMGYPIYFLNILGAAQLLGALALLAPVRATVKEWTYAGFGITYVSGFISHLASGDGAEALQPLIMFALLAASYLTRPPVTASSTGA